MFKYTKQLTVLLAFIFCSTISALSSASYYEGEVTGLGSGSHYDAICMGIESCVVVMVDSTHEKVGCNKDDSWSFVFDASTDTGKSTHSILLAAAMSGQKVGIGGTGECNIIASVEDLKFAFIKKW